MERALVNGYNHPTAREPQAAACVHLFKETAVGFRESEWSNSEGSLAGKPALLRRNESLADTNRAEYPVVLIVNLVLEDVDEEGLPYDEESHLAGEFEEAIASLVESRYAGLFAVALTSDGTRDLFFFLPAAVTDDELEAELLKLQPPLDFDFGFEVADGWHLYDTFA